MPTPNAEKRAQNALDHAITDAYTVLAAVLNRPPTTDFLDHLQQAEWHPDLPEALKQAFSRFQQATRTYSARHLQREFRVLFDGPEGGEVVPYASHYLEQPLAGLTLARLRSDLNRLGLARRNGVAQAEDHAGLLCEAVALLRLQRKISSSAYTHFLDVQVMSWMPAFFSDLEAAPGAGFYRSVAALGKCLLAIEKSDSSLNRAIGPE